MTPRVASFALWALWLLSWIAAALWSRRTQARASFADELGYRVFTGLGGLLLALASGAAWPRFDPERFAHLWRLPRWAAWLCVGIEAAGFAFTWWARLALGELWSSSVTRKERHEIVRTGPYGLVRHPIYTGLLAAALGLAIQAGALAGFLGVASMTFGFWLKARLEERLLSETLGPAYADYRRTTPMLAPFLRPRR